MRVDWAFLEKATIVITFITALVSVLWFAVSVVGRIDRLESQMQVITTTPSSGKSSNGAVVQNPIQQACAELARKASQEHRVDRGYTVDLMEKLGCGRQ